MRTFTSLIFILGVTYATTAQWEVHDAIELHGATPADRQITGATDPQDGTDLISASTLRDQGVKYEQASGVNDLSVQLEPAPTTLSAGMLLAFSTYNANTGPVTLNVNGMGAIPLWKNGNQDLDSADLIAMGSYQAMFDGNGFQLLNQGRIACPAGYMMLNRDVCIMTQVADSLNWYGANTYCRSRNARLCSIGEWHQACITDPLFFSTVIDYEWLDHAANDVNKAKTIGIDASSGLPDCNFGGHRLPTTWLRFRCCYSR